MIDRRFKLDEAGEALRYIHESHSPRESPGGLGHDVQTCDHNAPAAVSIQSSLR
jgi:hypothetical protein